MNDMKLPDYHTHTERCKHARGRPVDYALAAHEAGLPEMACTDHCPAADGYNGDHRMAYGEFEDYLADVEEARSAVPIPILLGIEADYYIGCERFLRPFLDAHPFDLVLGSVHWLDCGPPLCSGPQFASLGNSARGWRVYYDRIARLADTGLYDVASHLDFHRRSMPSPSGDMLEEIVGPALDRIAAADMAIEINTSGWFNEVGDAFPQFELLCLACERGIPITFGSDAHVPVRVGAAFDQALLRACAAGYTHYARYRRRERFLEVLPECTHSTCVEMETI